MTQHSIEQKSIDRHWLLEGSRRDYPLDRPLHAFIEEQVERTPDAVAVVFEDEQLSYRELDARANRLARRLQELGVGPDVVVGVMMERSPLLVVALLAVLKAGGAYLPLDPDYPRERLSFMLEDAGAPVVLSQASLSGRLAGAAAHILCLGGGPNEDGPTGDESTERVPGSAGDLAYVIYTSGSTGTPKGVMNHHRGIVNRLLWMQDEYGLGQGDVVMQKTPFSFDVSVWEFFWPLLAGARLVLARPGGHRDPGYLTRLVAEAGVTTMHFVPSMLAVFLEEPALQQRCRTLRRVICSGEALTPSLVQRFHEKLEASLHNLYGPTEAAVDVTHWTCRPGVADEPMPIGRPVANTSIYLLDEAGRPVKAGEQGELVIGGVQVARGYLNRPELTAERFVADPFAVTPGARMFKTGDLAR
ncbi:MAG TPA: amino acid adenylation domain-containing protein, partial [Trueperaceae bacterium]